MYFAYKLNKQSDFGKFNLFAGGMFSLYVDSYWLTTVMVAEGWGGCKNVLK